MSFWLPVRLALVVRQNAGPMGGDAAGADRHIEHAIDPLIGIDDATAFDDDVVPR